MTASPVASTKLQMAVGEKERKCSSVIRIDLTFLIWELGESPITPKISPKPLRNTFGSQLNGDRFKSAERE